MKKPSSTTGKSRSASNSIPIGKVMDVAKQGAVTVSEIAGIFKEKERTQQVRAQAQATVAQAREATEVVRVQAVVSMAGLRKENLKDQMAHEAEMQRLHDQRHASDALIRQRDRILDKILDEPAKNMPLLADSLRALTSRDDQ